ncbi:MAG: hypothetical protein CTR53_10415 [Ferrovibrio sp.]|nr:MAG: hypothetical protein CTR53_10415 [Ferrovibrio sp.]
MFGEYQKGNTAYLEQMKQAYDKFAESNKPDVWNLLNSLADRASLAYSSHLQGKYPSANAQPYRQDVYRDIALRKDDEKDRRARNASALKGMQDWLTAKQGMAGENFKFQSGLLDKEDQVALQKYTMDKQDKSNRVTNALALTNLGLTYEAKKSAERSAAIKMQYDMYKDGHEGIAKTLNDTLKQRDDNPIYKLSQAGLLNIENARAGLQQGTGIGDIVALRQFMAGVANEAKNTTDSENRAYLGQSLDVMTQLINRVTMLGEGGFAPEQRKEIEQALNIVDNNMNKVARKTTQDYYNRYQLNAAIVPGTKPTDWKDRGYVAFGLNIPQPTIRPVDNKLNPDFTPKDDTKKPTLGEQVKGGASKVVNRVTGGDTKPEDQEQSPSDMFGFNWNELGSFLDKWKKGSQQ